MTTPTGRRCPVVPVGPFNVADASTEQVVDALADLAMEESARCRVAYALHVGGLNRSRLQSFVECFAQADLAYADGASIVLLARAAGARTIERSPTTDVGVAVVERLAGRSGRRVKVALIGGPAGLAQSAGQSLATSAPADVVFTCDGYTESWESRLADLRRAAPDLVYVGLGMPLEAQWVQAHRSLLPPALVMTCGGWFSFLSGEEQRAPRLLQRWHLEWTWRLAQSPTRLLPRYVHGVVSSVVLLPSQWRQRRLRIRAS